MRVYVATSFKNIPEARAAQQALREAGHEITHDWTTKALDPAWPEWKREDYLRTCGDEDLAGVLSADVFVLINHEALRDGMAEFGVALGRGIPIVVVFPDRRSSVFFHRTAARAWRLAAVAAAVSAVAG